MKHPPETWIWMPHPAHLCIGVYCRFHLSTVVGPFIVSTVGEYVPPAEVREIYAQTRNIRLVGKGEEREYDYLKKIGFEEIGFGRKYETMVFEATKHNEPCCPYRQTSGLDLDMMGYNDAGDARNGHMQLCYKYANLALEDIPHQEEIF